MQYLIGIGAQKSGTTWLYQYLSKHPSVATTPLKELHFFDQIYCNNLCGYFTDNFKKQFDYLEKKSNIGPLNKHETNLLNHLQQRIDMKGSLDKYQQYLGLLALAGQTVISEITPSYAMLNIEGFTAIKDTLPHSKILFVMRDPVSRYWSQLRFHQMMNTGFEPLKNIEAFLKNQNFLERSNYKKTIQQLETVFSQDEICYIFYEDLFGKSTNEKTLEKITTFLNIDFQESSQKAIVNKSIEIELPNDKIIPIKDGLDFIYDFIYEKFGSSVPNSWL